MFLSLHTGDLIPRRPLVLVGVLHPAESEDEEVPYVIILLEVSDLPPQWYGAILTRETRNDGVLDIMSSFEGTMDIEAIIVLSPICEASKAGGC